MIRGEQIQIYKRKHSRSDQLVPLGVRVKRGASVRYLGHVYKLKTFNGFPIIHPKPR
jgi:hypothetical protein